MESFIQSLLKEIELQKNYLQDEVSTIYFGGGTPSLLPPKYLRKILSAIRSNFLVSPSVEITLESNPDDITTEKLEDWKKEGVERLSIGIQSFFDEDLVWMNRAHNAGQATQSIHLAQLAGYNNITIDLIYGTPTLTDTGWQQNLEMAFSTGVQHLSCYALTVEPKTALDTMIRQKKMQNVDTDKQARHFEMLMNLTKIAGFEQYEISNFARPALKANTTAVIGKVNHTLVWDPLRIHITGLAGNGI